MEIKAPTGETRWMPWTSKAEYYVKKVAPAGEMKERIMGGMPKLERAILNEVKPTQKFFERIFPFLRTKKLEKITGRKVLIKPEDTSPILSLFYKLVPRRVQFGKHPIASEIVNKAIKTQLQIEAETAERVDKIYEIEKAFNGKPEDYETLTDYIEAGIKDINKIPERYRETIKELRKSIEERIKVVEKELGIDTSKWQFTPENYIHHFWRGKWMVYDPETEKALFIGNLKKAQSFFEEYWKKHPTTKAIIKPRVVKANFTTTQLSRGGFWKLVSELANTMEISSRDLLEEISLQGVASIKRKRVFVGAFKPRLANLGGYVKDPFMAERIVWRKIIRKKYIEPFSKWAREQTSKLPSQMRIDMEKYLSLVEKSGFTEPSFWEWNKLVGKLTKLQANLKLGYRPTSALVNRLQDVQFTLPEVGFKIFIQGKSLAHTLEGRELIDKSRILVAPIKYEMGEWKPVRKTKWWKPLKMFDISEKAVRSEALCERFLEAFKRFDYHKVNEAFRKHGIKKEYKNQEDMALDYAIRAIASDMGFYNYTDFPEIMTIHPVVRIPSQFKFVSILWLDKAVRIIRGLPPAGTEIFFETNPLTPAEKASRFTRFWLINLLLSGTKIFKLLFRWVAPVALAYAFIKKPKWMNGIFSLIGLDVGTSFSTDPFNLIDINKKWWEQTFGATASDIKYIVKAIQEKDWKKLTYINPQLQKATSAIMAQDGILTIFYTDIPQAKLSFWERVALGLGFTPLKLTKARDLSFAISTLKKDYNKLKEAVERSWEKGDKNKAYSLVREWNTMIEKKWLPIIYERTAEIRGKELSSQEKVKIHQSFYVDADDFIRWIKGMEKEKVFSPYGIEKQLRIK